MPSRSGFARSFVFVLAAAAAGCSLASGWTDLQGGKKPSTSTTPPDASPSEFEEPGTGDADAPRSTDAGDASTPPALRCGTQTCTNGAGCCTLGGLENTCTSSASACELNGGSFLRCTKPSDCPSATPICCYDFGGNQDSTCTTSCPRSSGLFEACDLAAPQCTSGTCRSMYSGVPFATCL